MAIKKKVFVDGETVIMAEDLNAWQDELIDLANRKAGALIDTASGAIASFVPDSTIDNLLGVTVDVEPVQDLNGYDSPWPAGGGKNQAFNVQYANVSSRYQAAIRASYKIKAGKRYIFSFMTANTGKKVYRQTPDSLGFSSFSAYDFTCDGNRKSFYGTAATDTEKETVGIILKSENDSDPVGLCYDFMIEEVSDTTTTPSSYAPYENLCPISGWDAVDIRATGENLFNYTVASLLNAYINGAGILQGSGNDKLAYLQVKKDSVYTIKFTQIALVSAPQADDTQVGIYKAPPVVGLSGTRIYSQQRPTATGNYTFVFTVSTGDSEWIAVKLGNIQRTDIDATLKTLQVTVGSTVDDYKPYIGNTYTIQLGKTVYGGTPDVEAGTMTVDRAMVDLGTLAWGLTSDGLFYTDSLAGNIKPANWNTEVTESICSVYVASTGSLVYQKRADCAFGLDGNGRMYVYDSTKATMTAAEFKAAMSGVQLAYILKTPNEITITPAQIAAIAGQTNNVWADAGDVSVEYAADLKTYIDSKIAAAVAALS